MFKRDRGRGRGVAELLSRTPRDPSRRGPHSYQWARENLNSRVALLSEGSPAGRPESAVCRAVWSGTVMFTAGVPGSSPGPGRRRHSLLVLESSESL
jgi:hypothetical protein